MCLLLSESRFPRSLQMWGNQRVKTRKGSCPWPRVSGEGREAACPSHSTSGASRGCWRGRAWVETRPTRESRSVGNCQTRPAGPPPRVPRAPSTTGGWEGLGCVPTACRHSLTAGPAPGQRVPGLMAVSSVRAEPSLSQLGVRVREGLISHLVPPFINCSFFCCC